MNRSHSQNICNARYNRKPGTPRNWLCLAAGVAPLWGEALQALRGEGLSR